MTRLPQLEHDLVAAASRLSSPRTRHARSLRMAIAATALLAAAAAALAAGGLTGGGEHHAAPPPAASEPFGRDATLRDMLGVLRRPADTSASNEAVEKVFGGMPGEDVSRLWSFSVEGARGYLWPWRRGVCFSVAPRPGSGSGSSCAELAGLRRTGIAQIGGFFPNRSWVGGVAVDGIRQVRLTRSNGPDLVATVRDNAFYLAAPTSFVGELRWRYGGKEHTARVVGNPPFLSPPERTHRIEGLAGSFSEPLEFTVRGTRYSAQGFRTRSSVCVALRDLGKHAPQSTACLLERLVREALDREPAHGFAIGRARDGLVRVGLARQDVIAVKAVGSRTDVPIVLSKPWRPEPRGGDSIRFFLVFPPLDRGLHLTARLADGRTADVR